MAKSKKVDQTTKQINFEENLKEEKEKFENYVNLAGTILMALDKNGNILTLNKKGYEILGYKEGELLGKNWFETCLPKRIKKEVREVFKKLIVGEIKKSELFENFVLTKSGKEKIISWHNTIIKNSEGKIIGTLSSGEDITEKKEIEEKIKDSETTLQQVLDLLPVRIFWKDKSLNYLGCNKVFAEDAGFKSPKELLGKNDFQMSWKEQAEPYRADDKRIIESGKSKLNFEEPQTTPDGKKIWLLTSKTPLKNSNDEIIGILGTYSDITERKKIEFELEKKVEELQKFQSLTVDRELKMIELKKEVNELLKQLGRQSKYKID
jgi:PAS domain S-box-containing protein